MNTSLASIPDGTLALECPACPHPGRNLPQGWDEASEDTKYVALLLPLGLVRTIF